MKTAIRNWRGIVVGWMEEDPITGNKTIRDFYGVIKGRYNKRENITRDFYGYKIGEGDLLMSLINTSDK